MPNTTTPLRDRITRSQQGLVTLTRRAAEADGKWDNRPSWDNKTGKPWDNRPAWDNKSGKK